jgi:hypothetical protein
MEKKKYIINGKTYCQKKLVILQVKQLMAALEGVVFHDLSATGVIKSLDDLVPSIAAIVLTPEGARIKTKDMAFLADEFENELDFEKALEVTADFLAFNPISSIVSNLKKLTGMMARELEGSDIKTIISLSTRLSGNSAVETSPEKTG